jgi:hypothetical protein
LKNSVIVIRVRYPGPYTPAETFFGFLSPIGGSGEPGTNDPNQSSRAPPRGDSFNPFAAWITLGATPAPDTNTPHTEPHGEPATEARLRGQVVHGPDGEVYTQGASPPSSKPPISEWANTAHTAAVDM